MAATRIMPIHVGKSGSAQKAISRVIDYVENPEKTKGRQYVSSFQCNPQIAGTEFEFLRNQYQRNTGRSQGENEVVAYHVRQSFAPGEITPEEANRIGYELAERFTKGNHAFVVCTHIDKAHIHNHIVWSSVTLDCQHKFRNFFWSEKAVRNLSDTLCIKNGYSFIENPKEHGKTYDKWLGSQAQPSHREILRNHIDNVLAKKPKTLDELYDILISEGYEIKGRDGKNPSFRKNGDQRFIRMDTLGEAYLPAALSSVIAENLNSPNPNKTKNTKTEPSGNLLIDIQEKLRQGKGAGYEKWATTFNLKQIAQTVLFLQEHKLLHPETLSAEIEKTTSACSETQNKIKEIETKMAEVSKLHNTIIDYARTKKTFSEYKQRGYSKKFYEAHEKEILLHREAKKYFNEQNLTKLPDTDSLKKEYAALLSEKNAAYSEYRKQREYRKMLIIAKTNVENFLNLPKTTKKKKKDEMVL